MSSSKNEALRADGVGISPVETLPIYSNFFLEVTHRRISCWNRVHIHQ